MIMITIDDEQRKEHGSQDKHNSESSTWGEGGEFRLESTEFQVQIKTGKEIRGLFHWGVWGGREEAPGTQTGLQLRAGFNQYRRVTSH